MTLTTAPPETATKGPACLLAWTVPAFVVSVVLSLATVTTEVEASAAELTPTQLSLAATEGDGARPARLRIAYTRSRSGDDSALWTARPDGSHRRKVFEGPAYFPAWGPHHRRLIFDFPDGGGGQQVGIVQADGSHFRQLTDLPGISESPDFAPGGRRIVFARFSPDQPSFYTSLWVMRANGHHPRALFGPDSTTFDVEPEYSPDGSKIVFARLSARSDFEKVAVFVADADGSNVRRITPYALGLEHPRWSPSGNRIVYNILDSQTPRDGIYLVRANGDHRHRIYRSNRLLGFKPAFSPHGQRILFGCFVVTSQQDDLCTMRADGTRAHRITHTQRVFENFPVWR